MFGFKSLMWIYVEVLAGSISYIYSSRSSSGFFVDLWVEDALTFVVVVVVVVVVVDVVVVEVVVVEVVVADVVVQGVPKKRVICL